MWTSLPLFGTAALLAVMLAASYTFAVSLAAGGSTSGKGHYMNLTIASDGTITGFDAQDGRAYDNLEAVVNRLGRIDLIVRVSAPGAQ